MFKYGSHNCGKWSVSDLMDGHWRIRPPPTFNYKLKRNIEVDGWMEIMDHDIKL